MRQSSKRFVSLGVWLLQLGNWFNSSTENTLPIVGIHVGNSYTLTCRFSCRLGKLFLLSTPPVVFPFTISWKLASSDKWPTFPRPSRWVQLSFFIVLELLNGGIINFTQQASWLVLIIRRADKVISSAALILSPCDFCTIKMFVVVLLSPFYQLTQVPQGAPVLIPAHSGSQHRGKGLGGVHPSSSEIGRCAASAFIL